MKLFIASDIHGSAYYCKKMVDFYLSSGADKLVLLGDVLYHGPRNDLPKGYAPKEVIDILNPLKKDIICVRGNCEAEVDQMVLTFPVLSDYGVIFDGENTLYLSHGHRQVPPMSEGTYYFTGHTHVPHDKIVDGVRHLNPGSVSIPKENSPHSVIIWDNGEIGWYDIDTMEKWR